MKFFHRLMRMADVLEAYVRAGGLLHADPIRGTALILAALAESKDTE